MTHPDKKLLIFLDKYKPVIFFWVSFAIVFVSINTASNVVYDKFFTTNNENVTIPATDTPITDTAKAYKLDCSVLGISLEGILITYAEKAGSGLFEDTDITTSDWVISQISKAEQDNKIKAIIVAVDSGGGEPVAGEEIANALKMVTKPTVAYIRQSGLSSAYWAVSSADRIFASRNSDVGSIGITSSYLEDIDKNKQFIQLSSGKYKDTGNPDKPITEEEKALVMRDVKIMYQNFIEDVANNRKIPIDKVRNIADGSSMLGEKAKDIGLIDEIGGLTEAVKYLEGIVGERLHSCW